LDEGTAGNKDNHKSLVNAVCGNLDKNFSGVNEQLKGIQQLLSSSNQTLDDINSSINDLHATFAWKADMIIDELKNTNYVLDTISSKLDRPTTLINNQYCVKKALGYLSIALNEGSRSPYYAEAYKFFIDAIGYEHDDYFSHYKIGLIHLFSHRHLDPAVADYHFEEAIKFGYAAYKNDHIKKQWALDIVASSNYQSSKCNYILGKLDHSLSSAYQSVSIQGNNPVYLYQLAKVLSSNGNLEQAVTFLSQAIELNPRFFLMALSDRDFMTNDYILRELKRLSDITISTASNEILQISLLISDRSEYKSLSNQLSRECKSGNYLAARKALDEIGSKRRFIYIRHFGPNWTNTREETVSATLREIIKIELEEEQRDLLSKEYLHNRRIQWERKEKRGKIIKISAVVAIVIIMLCILNASDFSIQGFAWVGLLLIGGYLLYEFRDNF
jgi:tetratricopeptide (TPR) repeat protein